MRANQTPIEKRGDPSHKTCFKQKKEKLWQRVMLKIKARFIKREDTVWRPNLIKDFKNRIKN